ADVHPLHAGAAAEARDQVGVEARPDPARARGAGDEVELRGVPARALERRPRGPLAELEGAAAKARAQLVDRFVGTEVLTVDVEMAPGDVAGLEEAAT